MRAKRAQLQHPYMGQEVPIYPLNAQAKANLPVSLDISEAAAINLDDEIKEIDNIYSETISNISEDKSLCSESLSFKHKLREWALRFNISHVALGDLLKLLKTTPISADLPSDPRTLLGTQREVETKVVEPGSYHHFGFTQCLEVLTSNLDIKILNKMDAIYLNINIDGLPLFKSSSSQVYPILCSIVGQNLVEMIGIYQGKEKPKDANLFVTDFVSDATNIITNGINVNHHLYNVRIKGFICDAPAKSFIKCTKGHTGYSSCSKCYTEGEYIENRVCFPDHKNINLRTDFDFRSQKQKNHHTGTSIIQNIPHINMISSFPLDYMHLVCLGVVKKLLLLWCCGKPSTKISYQKISNISDLLVRISICIPKEFNRKPRSLNELKRWKATEFRQFLFYTGPLVLKNNISNDRYLNFISLHVAMIILSNERHFKHIGYASKLLHYFVMTFKTLYGAENVSHNVHNLLHLADDVKDHGPVDNFSSFPFENFLQSILKSLRKTDKPLEQIIKRHTEKINFNLSKKKKIETGPIVRNEHCKISLIKNVNILKQYETLDFDNFTIRIHAPDNCCCLKDETIIIVKDIIRTLDKYQIVGSRYLDLKSFYENPCESADFGVFKVQPNSLSALEIFDINQVNYKCIKLDNNEQCLIIPLLHTC